MVGALMQSVQLEYARESAKSLKAIESILRAVHTKK